MEVIDLILVDLDLRQDLADKLLLVDVDETIDEVLVTVFDEGDVGLEHAHVRDARRIRILERGSVFLEKKDRGSIERKPTGEKNFTNILFSFENFRGPPDDNRGDSPCSSFLDSSLPQRTAGNVPATPPSFGTLLQKFVWKIRNQVG